MKITKANFHQALVVLAEHLVVEAKTPTQYLKNAKWSTYDSAGNKYWVYETEPKRRQDVRRFEFWKAGKDAPKTPYVVSWQDRHGRQASCSCPSGIYRGACKHIAMCKELTQATKSAGLLDLRKLAGQDGRQAVTQHLTFEEFDKRVRASLEEFAPDDIKEDLKSHQEAIVSFIKQAHKDGWSVADAAKYISLTSDEGDEDIAIRHMDMLKRKYQKG